MKIINYIIIILFFLMSYECFSQLKFDIKIDYLVRNRSNKIEWKDDNKDLKFIEYSLDSGKTYNDLGWYTDSVNWKVPNFKFKTIRLKISKVLFSPPSLLNNFKNAHNIEIKSVDISKDNKSIISADKNSIIKIWDIASLSCIDSISSIPSSGTIHSKYFDSKQILIFLSDKIYKYDLNQKIFIDSIEMFNFITDRPSFSLNKQANKMSLGSNNGRILVYNTNFDKTPISDFIIPNYIKIYSTKLSKDGTKLVIGTGERLVYIYDLLGNILFSDTISAIPSNPIWAIDISKDNSQILAGTSNAELKIWDISNNSIIDFKAYHKSQIRAVQFANNYTMTASLDSLIKFHYYYKKIHFSGEVSHQGPVTDCYFSEDNKYFVSCGRDLSIKFWSSPEFRVIEDSIDLLLKYPISFNLPDVITEINNIEKIDINFEFDNIFSEDLINFKKEIEMGIEYPNRFLFVNPKSYSLTSGNNYDTIYFKNEVLFRKGIINSFLSRVLYTNKIKDLLSFGNIKIINSNEFYIETKNGSIEIIPNCNFNQINRIQTLKALDTFNVNIDAENINIDFNFVDQSLENLEIYDILGNLIFKHKIINTNNITIEKDNFKNGLYFIVFRNNYILKTKFLIID